MKIAFVGSRNFPNQQFVYDTVKWYVEESFIDFISGGAIGVDSWAEQVAREFNVDCEIIKPDWSKGRGAGIIRNKTIVDKCDKVVAFWDGYSKGTKYTIDYAVTQEKPVDIYIR